MSSASLIMISNEFSIYVGLFIFIFGIAGNLINIRLLFSTRTNPCSFLLSVSSFFNLIALSAGLLPRVLAIGFDIDPSLTNLICCKCRLFISYIGSITSIVCLCFASIDRFLVSCRSVTWCNRSQLSTAKNTFLISIPIIIAMNVPYLIFYTIVEVTSVTTGNTTRKCSSINPGLVLYGSYFVRPILLSTLPGIILGVTGWLTYRNITSIAGVQVRGTFQRRLTSMISLQIVTVIIPIIPFAAINVYQIVTSSIVKSSYRVAQETLVLDIANIILYISYASNFYVYLISASSYRRDFLRLILFCYGQNHWNNQIKPMLREHLPLNRVSTVQQLP